jgi:hypothetical protein
MMIFSVHDTMEKGGQRAKLWRNSEIESEEGER